MKQYRDPDALSQALAEPSRRAILENLRLGQKSVGELVEATELKQPNVSNHLARMRHQDIVRSERVGRHVYYSIALPVAELLLRLHETVEDPLAAFSVKETTHSSQCAYGAVAHEKGRGLPAEPRHAADEPTLEAWQQAFFQTILAGQEDRANAIVNDLLAHRVDIETIYLGVFEWAIRRIGELYVQGETDEAHEHMATEITERMMGRVALYYTPIATKPYRALLGGVAGNWHTLGIRMLSDGLRTQGWETLFLGANVPTPAFLTMAITERPDLVVISCMQEENWEELKRLLDQLHRTRQTQSELHYLLAAGGRYLNQNPQRINEIPIDFSAATLHDFLAAVAQVYPAISPPKK